MRFDILTKTYTGKIIKSNFGRAENSSQANQSLNWQYIKNRRSKTRTMWWNIRKFLWKENKYFKSYLKFYVLKKNILLSLFYF